MMDAVLRVGFPLGSSSALGTVLEERYVSRVRMIPPNRGGKDSDEQVWIVEAKSIQSNLFVSLKSRWRLSLVSHHLCNTFSIDDAGNSKVSEHSPHHTSCNVKFDIEIQVSNPLISFTLDTVLKDVARKQVDAFERRCRDEPFDSFDVDSI
jgi:ribosome-associated toxin RatA of RatAB toxin-antitoxin module